MAIPESFALHCRLANMNNRITDGVFLRYLRYLSNISLNMCVYDCYACLFVHSDWNINVTHEF